MNKKINLMCSYDAKQLNCPFKLGDSNIVDKTCEPEDCMAWTEVHSEAQREDHSGGRECIQQWARDLGVESWRTGPGGSTGYWHMRDAGYCKLLWPALDNISAGDYILYI